MLGGARSGKSGRALSIAEAARPEQIFIATAEAYDEEMAARIARHILDRGTSWETLEAPLALADVLMIACETGKAVLVDCLTLWLSNIMHAGLNVVDESERLLQIIRSTTTPIVLVSNEVGMGIVPESSLGRHFRDEQGRLNQRVAEVCDRVEFVAAGLPLTLKP